MRVRVYAAFAALACSTMAGCITQVSDAPKIAVPGPAPLSAEIRPRETIVLNLPNGEVSIVADAVDYTELHLEARCPSDSEKCRHRIGQLAWTARRADNQIVLELDGKATLNAELNVNIRLPHRNPLQVNMKYGSLNIEDARQPVKLQMKAGEVDISMPADVVRSAFLRARFGDATLAMPRSAISGRRPTLVGATVDWPDGQGPYPVSARLRYGDVTLRLLD